MDRAPRSYRQGARRAGRSEVPRRPVTATRSFRTATLVTFPKRGLDTQSSRASSWPSTAAFAPLLSVWFTAARVPASAKMSSLERRGVRKAANAASFIASGRVNALANMKAGASRSRELPLRVDRGQVERREQNRCEPEDDDVPGFPVLLRRRFGRVRLDHFQRGLEVGRFVREELAHRLVPAHGGDVIQHGRAQIHGRVIVPFPPPR